MCFFKLPKVLENPHYKNINLTHSKPVFIKFSDAFDIYIKNKDFIEYLKKEKNFGDNDIYIRHLKSVNKSLYMTYKHAGFVAYSNEEVYYVPVTSREDISNYDPKLYELAGLPKSYKNSTEQVTNRIYIPELKRPINNLILNNVAKLESLENNEKIMEKHIKGKENLEIIRNAVLIKVEDANTFSINDAKLFYNFHSFCNLIMPKNDNSYKNLNGKNPEL